MAMQTIRRRTRIKKVVLKLERLGPWCSVGSAETLLLSKRSESDVILLPRHLSA